MKENVFKSFVRDTFVLSSSVIPYFITVQAVAFVILCILDLLTFSDITPIYIYPIVLDKLSLPNTFTAFIQQPWSFVTHILVYQSIWAIVFDCLWLYWIGNLFLSFLNKRHFNFVFFGALTLSSTLYIISGFIPTFDPALWSSSTFGIVALLTVLLILIPNSELRLFLFGNVRFKYIALIYLALQAVFFTFTNHSALLVEFLIIGISILFIRQLQQGRDWSLIVSKNRRSKLKVVKSNISNPTQEEHFPNQEQIDQILDKISLNGYESLTSHEKSILFKASKKED